MAIYRLKLFTSESGHEKEDREYCINNNLMAIGWPIDGTSDIKEYRKQAKCHKDYSDNENLNGGLKVSLNAIEDINKGDLVWTQIDGLDYRLGKVVGDCEINDGIGPSRKCLWKEIKFDYIPGDIISRFVGRGYVLCQVHCSDEIEEYCQQLYEKDKDFHIENIKGLLHYDDLEDLAGLYLQEKKKYYIIPSTNKQGAKLIEYELRDKRGNKACIQCKIGNSSVEVDKICEEFNGYKIFVCVLDEKQKGGYTDKKRNIEEITFDELFKWAKKHKKILPQRIQNYIKLTES